MTSFVLVGIGINRHQMHSILAANIMFVCVTSRGFLGLCIDKIAGTMFATHIADIQVLAGNISIIEGVYGFRSFFRSVNPNDCDLLVVVNSEHKNGNVHRELHLLFDKLAESLKFPIDLVIVTSDEFSTIPLIERDTLFQIFPPSKPQEDDLRHD